MAPIPPFGGIVGDFGGARFRVSLVRCSPFQASFRPMPEPFLRVHPLPGTQFAQPTHSGEDRFLAHTDSS
jgi:hypothetical protein